MSLPKGIDTALRRECLQTVCLSVPRGDPTDPAYVGSVDTYVYAPGLAPGATVQQILSALFKCKAKLTKDELAPYLEPLVAQGMAGSVDELLVAHANMVGKNYYISK
jgi:hypothetical protein